MILFVTRLPPNSNGHGGSQRAMHILRKLTDIDEVDILMVHRKGDLDAAGDALRHARPLTRTAVQIEIPAWTPPKHRWPFLSWKQSMVVGLITPYCSEAPWIPARTLHKLVARLPDRNYDLIVAGRLPCASIAADMIKAGLLASRRKIVDLDDVMSRFKRRQVESSGAERGRAWHWLQKVELARIERAEKRVLREWDAASVCTQDDVELLHRTNARAQIFLVPNVVDKFILPPSANVRPKLLFVGALSFAPKVHGLRRFLSESWPKIQQQVEGVSLDVVGFNPGDEVSEMVAQSGGHLHANVPSLEPYYRQCDVVLSPIFFGGGTRIKILEAMAYGRAVVSTTMGAEGLGVAHGRHALIADDMDKFADAVVELCRDTTRRQQLVGAARQLQQQQFSTCALAASLDQMIRPATANMKSSEQRSNTMQPLNAIEDDE